MFNKTKIICTVGPASGSKEKIKALIKEGVDAFRLNFSHGDFETHREYVKNIRESEKELGIYVSIIQDLQGPRIRVGKLKDKQIDLKENETIIISSKNILGDNKKISTTYENFCKDVKIKQRILIDDGLIMLTVIDKVRKKEKYNLICKVIKGGLLKENKGINLPDTKLSIPSLTEKDLKDIDSGIKLGVDMIALSFVRKATDIVSLKKILKKKKFEIPIIAKIERPEAIKDIEEIIKKSDVIMIARGDLGVEMSPEEVPILQKLIIKKCNENLKPVITATQMLESMVKNRIPTRAEATDVANAILDGTDCVMLSAETSIGFDPVNAVRTMSKIIQKTEEILQYKHQYNKKHHTTLEILCNTASELANELKVETIITLSRTGKSPLYLSNRRGKANIVVLTSNPFIHKFSNILWGVKSFLCSNLFKIKDIMNFVNNNLSNETTLNKSGKAILIYNESEKSNESADTISIVNINYNK
ncbi:MAG: pyruvate kinase [Ignavibacteria bacterium]|nr:pyruvate kinase [Ignavibacteria bacterium]